MITYIIQNIAFSITLEILIHAEVVPSYTTITQGT